MSYSPAITSWLFCMGTDVTDRSDERMSSDRALPPSSCRILNRWMDWP